MHLENKPLFSVIIPIYNKELFINQCLTSVIMQSYSNYEIILIDDGSVDSSSQICDYFVNKYKNVIVIHKNNGGLVNARKIGSLVANGFYSVCLDGDDYICGEYLKHFATVIVEKDVDIVFSNFKRVYEDKTTDDPAFARFGFYSRNDIEKEIFPQLLSSKDGSYFRNNICGTAIKTELYRVCQSYVDDSITLGEDVACMVPCIYAAKSLYVLPYHEYCYRSLHNSMSKDKTTVLSWDYPELTRRILIKQIDIGKYDFQEQLDRMIVAMLFNVAPTRFYAGRKYREVKRDILSAINQPLYANAIAKAKFGKSLKGVFALLVLRYKLIVFIWFYSKL